VPANFNSPLLVRYDTTGALSNPSSWSDMTLSGLLPQYWSVSNVAFDGRYIYLIGVVGQNVYLLARFDTTGQWGAASSWSQAPASLIPSMVSSSATFDGQYLYLANDNGVWRFQARTAGPLPSFLPGGTLD
jgi:hypothetical protein